MKLCFPVIKDSGMESIIYGHFASSPLFLVVDTDTRQTSAIPNCDPHNPYQGCNPFCALRGRQLDAIIAGGMGDDSLRTMHLCGFRVFEAQSESIVENITLFENRDLAESVIMDSHLEGRCSGSGDSDSGNSHGCGHTRHQCHH